MKKFLLGVLTSIFFFVPFLVLSAPNLSGKLQGKILLAVEDHGKTYYVHSDGKRYRVDKDTAQKIFEKLALGITNKNLEEIPEGSVGITIASETQPATSTINYEVKYNEILAKYQNCQNNLFSIKTPTCPVCQSTVVEQTPTEQKTAVKTNEEYISACLNVYNLEKESKTNVLGWRYELLKDVNSCLIRYKDQNFNENMNELEKNILIQNCFGQTMYKNNNVIDNNGEEINDYFYNMCLRGEYENDLNYKIK